MASLKSDALIPSLELCMVNKEYETEQDVQMRKERKGNCLPRCVSDLMKYCSYQIRSDLQKIRMEHSTFHQHIKSDYVCLHG